jgi:predicted unusual protein kinase regulating ubiquinone biosynthesis (AarF/ABC1/UbiB family)
LFVYPIPPEADAGIGDHGSDQPMNGKPFYLIFIDFGMVGRLTPEIVAGLRETLVAMTTRDAHRLVQSYQRLGILLPSADHNRIEAATRAAFDRVWGMNMSQLSGMQFSEMKSISREFSDLLFSMPFQVPQDFLYLARAAGILFGMCTGLDPALDPWREMSPFVQEMLSEQGEAPGLRAAILATDPRALFKPQTLRALLTNGGIQVLTETGTDIARRMFQLPLVLDEVLRQANRGELSFQIAPSPELNREMRKLEKAIQRMVGAVMFAGLAFSSALLYTVGEHTLSWVGMFLTLITFIRVVLSINTR